MSKNCNTCKHWKRYRRLEDRCVCEAQSGGNCNDLYTSFDDKCRNWEKFESGFKEFWKAFKKHDMSYPQTEDLY